MYVPYKVLNVVAVNARNVPKLNTLKNCCLYKNKDEMTYAKWICKNNQYQKMEMINSGSDIAIQLQDLLNKKLKLQI